MKRIHGGAKGLAYARKYGQTHFPANEDGEDTNQQVLRAKAFLRPAPRNGATSEQEVENCVAAGCCTQTSLPSASSTGTYGKRPPLQPTVVQGSGVMNTQPTTPGPAPKRSNFLESINADLAARGMLPAKPGDDAVCTPDPCSEASVPHEGWDEVKEFFTQVQGLHDRVDTTEIKKRRQTSTFGSPGGKLQIMDPKKASNVEIVLKKFKMPSHCIADAIDNLDAGVLHADLLPQLVATIPTAEDISSVRESIEAYGGYKEVRSRLGAAETFFMELHRVRRVHAKVKVLQFKQDFVEMLDDIKETLDKIEKATEDAFRSQGLQESLRLILAIGNRLNLSSSLPENTKPNPLQLMRFRKRMVQVFDLDCLERVLGTRVYLDEGAKMSHFLVAFAELHYPQMLSLQDSLSSMRDAQSIGFDDLHKRIEDLQEGLSAVRAEADEAAKAPSSQSGSRQCSVALMSPSPVAMTIAADSDIVANVVSPRIAPIAPGFSRSKSAACRATPSRSPLASNSGIIASTELRAPEAVTMLKSDSISASGLPNSPAPAPANGGTAGATAEDVTAAADAEGVGMETPRAVCMKENPLAPDLPDLDQDPTSVSLCNNKKLTVTNLSPAPESQTEKPASQSLVPQNVPILASDSQIPEKEQAVASQSQQQLSQKEQDRTAQTQQQVSDSSNTPLWWKQGGSEPAQVPATPPEEQNTPPLPTKDASAVDSKATDSCTPASDTLTQHPSWMDVNGQASETLSVSPGSLPPVTFSPGLFPACEGSPADAVLMYAGNAATAHSLSPTPTPTAFTGDAQHAQPVPTVSGAQTQYHTPLPSMNGEISADSCAGRYPDTGNTCRETPAMVTFASADHVRPNAKPLFPVASGVPTNHTATISEYDDSPVQAEGSAVPAPPPPPPPLPPPPTLCAAEKRPAAHLASQPCASPTFAPRLKLAQILTAVRPPTSPCGGSALNARSQSQPPPAFSPAASFCSDSAALTRTMSHQGCSRPALMSPPHPRPPLLPRMSSPMSAVGGSPPPRPLGPPKKLPMAFFDANGVAMLRHDHSDRGSEKGSERGAPEQLTTTAAPPTTTLGSPQTRPPTPQPPLPRFPRLPRLPILRRKKKPTQPVSPASQNSPRPLSPPFAAVATQPQPHAQRSQALHQPKYFNIDSLNHRRKSGTTESSDEATNNSLQGDAPAYTPASRESSCRSPPFGTEQPFPAEQLVQHRSLPGGSITSRALSPLCTRHSLPGDPSTDSLAANQSIEGYSFNFSPSGKLLPATVCPGSPRKLPEASKNSITITNTATATDTAANAIAAATTQQAPFESSGLSVVPEQPESSAVDIPSALTSNGEGSNTPNQCSTYVVSGSESQDGLKFEQTRGSGASSGASDTPTPAHAASFGSTVASVMQSMPVSRLLPCNPPTDPSTTSASLAVSTDAPTTTAAAEGDHAEADKVNKETDSKSETVGHSNEDCTSKGSAELRTAGSSQSSSSLGDAAPEATPAHSAAVDVPANTQAPSPGLPAAATTADSSPVGSHAQQTPLSRANGVPGMETHVSSGCTRRSSMSSLHPLSGVSDAIRTCYSDDCSSTPSPFVSGMLGAIQRVVSAGADSTAGSMDSPGSPLRACRACIGPMDSVLDFGQSRPGANTGDIIAQGSNVSLAGCSKGPFDGEITVRGSMEDSTQPTGDVQTLQLGKASDIQASTASAADIPTTPPPVDTSESEKSPRLHHKVLRGVHSETSEGEASGAFGELTLTVPSPLGSGSQIAPVASQTLASEQISEALQGLKDQMALDAAVSAKPSLAGIPQDAQVPDLAITDSNTLQQQQDAEAATTTNTDGVATEAPSKEREPRLSIEVPEKAGDACRDTAPDLSPATAAHRTAEPDLSPAGAALGAPQSPFFDRSPWAGSFAESHEGAGDLRDFSGLHRGQRTPSQAADSDALRTFLQGAEAEAAQAEARLRKAQARFKELMTFFSQPLHKELQGQPAAFMGKLWLLVSTLTLAQANKERAKVDACIEAFVKSKE